MVEFNSKNFDGYFANLTADVLKRIVSVYGGASTMRKQECINYLHDALSKPQVLRKAVASLEPFERFGLALLKQMGGTMEYEALGTGILAAGYSVPRSRFSTSTAKDIASHLLKHGLVASERTDLIQYFGYGEAHLFADSRLLAQVGPPQPDPIRLDAATPPSTTVVRMPPTVVLEIIGFLQTLENLGGLGLTKQGTLRVNQVRKFQKALQWPEDDLEVDGLIFPDALNGFISALRHSDFLEYNEKEVFLRKPVAEIAGREYADQVSVLLNGFLRLTEWNESGATDWRSSHLNYRGARMALLIALTALPWDSEDFYTLDEFDRALFERIGQDFSLNRYGGPRRFPTYGKSAAEVKQLEADWQVERRQQWLQQERIWLEEALSSWLYYLGMVELGLEDNRVVSFRLTDLGKAVLHPAAETPASLAIEEAIGEGAGTWIVQPNFDVVVYLDRTTPTQLAFLEQHAERTQSQQYTAHYRLTRESVYRGLESGTTLDELLDELTTNAQTPLPQNVTVEIREWAALREQVILHRRAHLVEFPTPDARQKALDADTAGTPVGDRFLLLSAKTVNIGLLPKAIGVPQRINYLHPLSKVLHVSEAGLIRMTTESSDLLIKAQLDLWAERTAENCWQLTEESVKAHIKAGAKVDELIDLLTARLSHNLPPMLELALRNWTGRRTKSNSVELEQLTVLRCHNAKTLHTILGSKRFKSCLRGQLGEDVLLFESSKEDEVRELLEWAGMNVSVLSA